MSGINNPSGGVGSPFKAKLEQMPAGASALKQVEEETKTFKENIQSIVGGVGGAVGNIEQGITNFLTSIGLPPRVEKETSFDADQATIDKARKKIGVSQYQWDTGGGADVHTRMAIDKEKKELGLHGKVVEIENPNFNPDEEISETNPETVKTREYSEFNLLTGKTDRYVYDPVTGKYNVQASVEGGVDGTDGETTEQTVVEETVDNDFKKDITDYATAIDHENIPDWKKGDEISEEVKTLQEGLISIYGEDILPEYGADGKMGQETRDAIQKLLDDKTTTVTTEDATTTVDGGVTNPNSLENLKSGNKTNTDIENFEVDDIKAIQTEMINAGADLSYTKKNGEKVEGLDAADGDWGPRSQQAYDWYLSGKDMKDFKYKPVKRSKSYKPTDLGNDRVSIKSSDMNTRITSAPWYQDHYPIYISEDGVLTLDHGMFFEGHTKPGFGMQETVQAMIATLTDEEYANLGGSTYRGDTYWDTKVFTNLYGFDYYLSVPTYHRSELEDMGLEPNHSTSEGETITIETSDGTYTGEMKNGKFHGQGTFVWNDDNSNAGNKIEATFKDGKIYKTKLTTKKGLVLTYDAKGDNFFNLDQLEGTPTGNQ